MAAELADSETIELATAPFKIVYAPTLPEIAPADADCPHRPEWNLSLNVRLEAVNKNRKRAALDSIFCMRCGAFHTTFVEYDGWHDAFGDLWREIGWNRIIGERLMEFARLHTGGDGFATYLLLQGIEPHSFIEQMNFDNASLDRWDSDGGAIA